MIQNLIKKIKQTGAPICVGLDPMLDYIPAKVKQEAYEDYGEAPEGAAIAILTFNRAIIDATCDLIPAVKLQIAMYEQFGIPGLIAYEKTAQYCKKKGLIEIEYYSEDELERLVLMLRSLGK